MAATTNYGWEKPTVGGSNDLWGAMCNVVFDAIDTALKAVSDVANAALAKAGGAMTGRIDMHSMTVKKTALGSVSGDPVNLDLSGAQYFTATASAACTFAITNTPATANAAVGFILRLTNGGNYTMTWPASVKWENGLAPDLTTGGTDVLVFITDDAGTTWRATIAIKDPR